jgi:hypothetical protein
MRVYTSAYYQLKALLGIAMGWLRHVIIDFAIVLVILAATFGAYVWAAWIVWIYTPLMLLLKLGSVVSKVTPSASGVPHLFYHVIYAVSVVVLLYHAWYWEAAGWTAIWILSVISEVRGNAPMKKAPKA